MVPRSLMCCLAESMPRSGRRCVGGNGSFHYHSIIQLLICVPSAWGRLLLAGDGLRRHLLLYGTTRCAGSKMVRRS